MSRFLDVMRYLGRHQCKQTLPSSSNALINGANSRIDKQLPLPTPLTPTRSSSSSVGTALSPPTFPSTVPRSPGLAVVFTVLRVLCFLVACTFSQPHTWSPLCWAGTSSPLPWPPLLPLFLSSPRSASRPLWPSPSSTTA